MSREGREVASGKLTTHILDTARGCPASGMHVDLFRIEGAERSHITSVVTNHDGRLDKPLLDGASMARGTYELVFHVGHYLKICDVDLTDPPFLDDVPLRFGIADPDRHYHVPLLVSPYGYTTYRGS
ncbi:MAG: hydroxyisourate hydrolase [Geminicoccaceae bacterium]|nr:hydroxyisourate hydrolase [Geminicoccaceae bacterium]